MLKKLPGTVLLTRPIVVPTLVLGLTSGFALFALVTALQGASPVGSLTTLVIILLLLAALRDFPFLHKRPLMLMLAVAILIPFRIDTDWAFARSISIADIALAAVGLLVALLALGNRRLSHMSRPAYWWWGVLYCALSGLSLFWSPSTAATVRQILILGTGLCTFFILDTLILTPKTLAFAIRVFVGLGLLSAVVAWIYWFFRPDWLFLYDLSNEASIISWQTRVGSPFWGASNYLASLLMFSFPICVVGIFNPPCRRQRGLWLSGSLVLCGTIVATLSLGVGFAFIVALVFLVYSSQSARSRLAGIMNLAWIKWVVIILVPMVLILKIVDSTSLAVQSPLTYLANRLSRLSEDSDIQSRLIPIANIALPRIADSPLVGYGAGATGVDAFSSPSSVYRQTGFASTGWHNAYITALYELGIFGGLIFLTILLSMFRTALQAATLAKQYTRSSIILNFAVAAPATLIGLGILLSVETGWESSVFQWLFWFYAALLSASRRMFVQVIPAQQDMRA